MHRLALRLVRESSYQLSDCVIELRCRMRASSELGALSIANASVLPLNVHSDTMMQLDVWEVQHEIVKGTPLYDSIFRDRVLDPRLIEIDVTLSVFDTAYSQEVKLHTSYHHTDVVVGARFQPMVRTLSRGPAAERKSSGLKSRINRVRMGLSPRRRRPSELVRTSYTWQQEAEPMAGAPGQSEADRGSDASKGSSAQRADMGQTSRPMRDSVATRGRKVPAAQIVLSKLDSYELVAPPPLDMKRSQCRQSRATACLRGIISLRSSSSGSPTLRSQESQVSVSLSSAKITPPSDETISVASSSSAPAAPGEDPAVLAGQPSAATSRIFRSKCDEGLAAEPASASGGSAPPAAPDAKDAV